MAFPTIRWPWADDPENPNPWWDRSGQYSRESAERAVADPGAGMRQVGQDVQDIWTGAQGAGQAAYGAWQGGMAASPVSPQNVVRGARGLMPSGQSAPEQNAPASNPATTPVQTPTGMPSGASDQQGEDYMAALIQQAKDQSRLLAAQAQKAEADAKEAAERIRRANDPNSTESQAARVALQTANANLETAKAQLEQIRNSLPPEAQIRLTDQLARERIALESDIRRRESADARNLQLQDRADDRRFTQSENAANRQFQLDLEDRRDARADRQWGEQRELRILELMMGREDREADRALRREESAAQYGYYRERDARADARAAESLALEREKMAQEYELRMLAHQVAKGELSAKKAIAAMQNKTAMRGVKAEERRNEISGIIGALPYMTGLSEGSIPSGFESGGPMARLTQMAGGSYNPQNYAVHPRSINEIQAGNTYTNPGGPAPAAVPPMVAAATPSPAAPTAADLKKIQERMG